MSTTGHESEAINVQGLKASLQKLKTNHIDAEATARANAVSAEATRAQAAESQLSSGKADKATTLAGYGISNAYTKSETYTKTEVNGLVDTPHQDYVTVPTYASLPASGSKDTIYRVSNYNGSTSQVDASVYSEYAWNGSQYVFLCVKSQIGEVFDISVYNNNAKYADLAAALNGGANIPQSLQKGGMSVKFVQSSDNKYVQARCMAQDFTTDVTQWQGVDDEPTFNSKNLIESNSVAQGLYLLYGVMDDGTTTHDNQHIVSSRIASIYTIRNYDLPLKIIMDAVDFDGAASVKVAVSKSATSLSSSNKVDIANPLVNSTWNFTNYIHTLNISTYKNTDYKYLIIYVSDTVTTSPNASFKCKVWQGDGIFYLNTQMSNTKDSVQNNSTLISKTSGYVDWGRICDKVAVSSRIGRFYPIDATLSYRLKIYNIINNGNQIRISLRTNTASLTESNEVRSLYYQSTDNPFEFDIPKEIFAQYPTAKYFSVSFTNADLVNVSFYTQVTIIDAVNVLTNEARIKNLEDSPSVTGKRASILELRNIKDNYQYYLSDDRGSYAWFYSDSETYGIGQKVVLGDNVYRSKQDNNIGHSVEDTDWWDDITSTLSYSQGCYLESKCRQIEALIGKKFFFVTDTHIPRNARVSSYLMDYVSKRCDIKEGVFGGDCVDANVTKYLAADVLTEYASEFFGVFPNGLFAIGNHDANSYTVNSYGGTKEMSLISDKEVYERTVKNIDDIVFDDNFLDIIVSWNPLSTGDAQSYWGKMHYYYDDKENKTRYIIMETGDNSAAASVWKTQSLWLQFNFLVDALNNIPSGYDAVIFGHQFGNSTTEGQWHIPTFYSYSSEFVLFNILLAYRTKTSITVDADNYSVVNDNYPYRGWKKLNGEEHSVTFDFTESDGSGKVFIVGGHFHNDLSFVAFTNNGATSVKMVCPYNSSDIDAFDQSKVYVAGNYVTYDNVVYACKISSSGAWSSDNWIECVAKDQIPANSVLCLWRNSDAYAANYRMGGSTRPTMTQGTITEQSFDVFTIKNTSVVITKIGAGIDIELPL